MKKYKVFVPDNPAVVGGWKKVATIEAEDEKGAMRIAQAKYGEKILLKEIK